MHLHYKREEFDNKNDKTMSEKLLLNIMSLLFFIGLCKI